MIIDCDTCVLRDLACADCVVSVLLGPPGAVGPGFDAEQRVALGVLADSGLVPPLRLVSGDAAPDAALPPAAPSGRRHAEDAAM